MSTLALFVLNQKALTRTAARGLLCTAAVPFLSPTECKSVTESVLDWSNYAATAPSCCTPLLRKRAADRCSHREFTLISLSKDETSGRTALTELRGAYEHLKAFKCTEQDHISGIVGRSHHIFNILPPKLDLTVGKEKMCHPEADGSPVTSFRGRPTVIRLISDTGLSEA